MEKLDIKYEQLVQALHSLEFIVSEFHVLLKTEASFNSPKDYENRCNIYRDSLIQRFEYCIDLFWKYLKKYLELGDASLPVTQTPRDVIILAADMKLIHRDEAETILKMIKSRNMTSHIYVEEIADQISKLIPNYYTLLTAITTRLQPHPAGLS